MVMIDMPRVHEALDYPRNRTRRHGGKDHSTGRRPEWLSKPHNFVGPRNEPQKGRMDDAFLSFLQVASRPVL